MSPEEFVRKWQGINQKERSAAQSHFNDLCALLDIPNPLQADPSGLWYAFEVGVTKTSGGEGWADVWKRHCFAWEYKGKHKDLDKAYAQLQQYAVALENPPLLVTCDIERIVVTTNWTNTVSVKYEISLEDLLKPGKRELLARVFNGDERLRTGESRSALTAKVARKFGGLAQELQAAGHDPLATAHFVNRLVFCLFAEDVGILPGELFTRLLDSALRPAADFLGMISSLFRAMQSGGTFGADKIVWFNGGLFDDDTAIPLTTKQIRLVREAASLDWSAIDPAIFGTLFERGLDPSKRSQLGAHYTDPENIMRIVEPVVLAPLREEWLAVRAKIEATSSASRKKPILQAYLARLRGVHVLDPACGSGNFLYIALRGLKDLEHFVLLEAERLGLGRSFTELGVECVRGIELSPYAAELARVTVWIGELQWQVEHGFDVAKNPVLKPLETIENRNALLSEGGNEATWPVAEFIIGNPPFLGGSLLRRELGNDATERMLTVFSGRLPNASDLCAYWFEKARSQVETGASRRVGLIATQGIRGGANRTVLERVKETGSIFFAWSDLDWVLEGAAVHVSIVGFDCGEDKTRFLNGAPVSEIHANLTGEENLTTATALRIQLGICFMGPSAKAPFDIDEDLALTFLTSPNAHSVPNSDVIRPVATASDLVGSNRRMWTVDFDLRDYGDACRYESPFQKVHDTVRPARENRRDDFRGCWWQYARPRVELRTALQGLHRALVTPGVSKHRIFRWYDLATLCNQGTLVFAVDDDYTFGILQSRFHEAWALAQGTQLEDRPRYTPTTCFETFPFPDPSGNQSFEISEAARELDLLRENWLNPPEWTQENILVFPATVGGPWHRWIPNAGNLMAGDIAEAHYVRRVARRGVEKIVGARTLTKLYNLRPAWLRLVHERLDKAVAAAYGLPADISESDLLAALLKLNLQQSNA